MSSPLRAFLSEGELTARFQKDSAYQTACTKEKYCRSIRLFRMPFRLIWISRQKAHTHGLRYEEDKDHLPSAERSRLFFMNVSLCWTFRSVVMPRVASRCFRLHARLWRLAVLEERRRPQLTAPTQTNASGVTGGTRFAL